ncbi:heme-binding protein [Frankia sp. AgB1.8]|nr:MULTISPECIES: heme-binding protein [unclassified Frankia]MBL7621520.1 heme-binding protein [Frankia sp. AgB1.8]
MILSLADARRVIAAGERRAHQLGQPMNIAVVDRDGNLVSHVRMDGAWTGSVDVSIRKAVDACRTVPRVASGRVFDLAATGARWDSPNGGPRQDDARPGARRDGGPPAAGGVPLLRDDAVVGAVGVSGGSPTQDHAVAQAAVAAL